MVEDLFGVGTTLKLKCEESDEELQVWLQHSFPYCRECRVTLLAYTDDPLYEPM